TYRGGTLAPGMETRGAPDMLGGFALGASAGSFAVAARQPWANIVGARAGAYAARKGDRFYMGGALPLGL
ncbi:hypothetical protein, partial [Mesorhizobium sp. GbtcB19]|uniref:hypothetical protein n=1 Tax=Mesorhizobium sp. GbtcB19 TaxID=2824764 RepID=UPI001C30FBBE